MLNFEKYKDDINDFVEEVFVDDILCEVSEVLMHNNECNNDCETCKKNSMRWLLQEYKESILNEEGKEFLKQLIAPFKSNEIVSVCKNEDLQILRIDYKIGWTCYSKKVLGEKWDWFKNLNPEKLYTLEELGLRERLKGE